MKLIALLLAGLAPLYGGVECVALEIRNRGFGAVVANDLIHVESTKPADDAKVAKLKGMPFVASIHLLGGGFGDKGVAQLADLPYLRVLVLKSSKLTDDATLPISKLNKVAKLDLMGARLSSKGLTRLRNMPELKHLFLHSATIKPHDLECLKSFGRLQTLTLPASARGVLSQIKAALPETNVFIPEEALGPY